MEIEREIGLAIECAVAASRWRIAARFETPERARQFRSLAKDRSAAATVLLQKVVCGTARSNASRPARTRTATQGG